MRMMQVGRDLDLVSSGESGVELVGGVYQARA